MNLRLRLFSREPTPSRYQYLFNRWRDVGLSPIPLQELDAKTRSDAIQYGAPVLSAVRPTYFEAKVFAEPELRRTFEQEALARIKDQSTDLYDVKNILRECEDLRSVRRLVWFDSEKAIHNASRIETIARQLETIRIDRSTTDFGRYRVGGQSPRVDFDPYARELRYTVRPKGVRIAV